MKDRYVQIITVFLLCLLVVGTATAAAKETAKGNARVNPTGTGWEKISESGIMGDRQNSYAWSMEVFDGTLWVGTNRNIFAFMLQQMMMGGMLPEWPEEVPEPTDMRPGIYRMDLKTGEWEEFYRPSLVPSMMPPPLPSMMPIDGGYRMMKTFTAGGKDPVLYVGSLGASARLLAIEKDGSIPIPVFATPPSSRFISIRAIEAHEGRLFWATDDMSSGNEYATPALWYSADPLSKPITKVPIPDEWVAP
jgi:hypothetical protein